MKFKKIIALIFSTAQIQACGRLGLLAGVFALGLALNPHPAAATSKVLKGSSFGEPKKLRYFIYGDNHILSSTQNVLPLAFELVAMTLRDRFELIEVKGKDYDIFVDITDRASVINRNLVTKRFVELNHQNRKEAYSYPARTNPNKPIVIRILWEEAVYRLLENGSYGPRPDAYARLTTILGREILGNYQVFKRNHDLYESFTFLNSETAQMDEVMRAETRALEAGVEFLTKLLKEFENALSPKLSTDFKAALQTEMALVEKRAKEIPSKERPESSTIIDFAKARCEKNLK